MPVIAVDGPSGAGKSSVSKLIATHFGWSYLDTGALYRALTFFALDSKVALPSQIPTLLPAGAITWLGNPTRPEIFLSGRLINEEIRSREVTERVSEVAADPEVRSFLLQMQRTIINQARPGIVVEGRDIGTTVWPDAELKIFLTADLRARAERRNAELEVSMTNNEVQESLASRDVRDSTRSTSPLRQIDEQVIVDATHLTLEEVVAQVQQLIIDLRLTDDNE